MAAMGPAAEVPLSPSVPAAEMLAIMRRHELFPFGGGRWRCFPTRELHETDDKKLWEGATKGWPLWKGESFDQFDPNGRAARWCPPTDAAIKKARKPRPGMDSRLARVIPLSQRREALLSEVGNIRLAFRDVTNRTNSRSVIACLIPAKTFFSTQRHTLYSLTAGIRNASFAVRS